MSEYITIKHSYNAGDLIALMAGLKKLHEKFNKKVIIYQVLDFPAFYYTGAVSPITDEKGYQVCMNHDVYERLKPLIEYQDYIKSFLIFKGEKIDFDIDLTRDSKLIPMPAGLLHHYAFSVFPEMSCDLSKPWISVPDENLEPINKFIVNRTQRYTNAYINYYFLKKHESDFIFLGLESERDIFCKAFDLNLQTIKTKNFLQLALIMKNFKGGLYNQSFLWHLADSMKLPRILELCPQFPNTFPTGANGFAFYNQKAGEYFVHKMISNDL